MAPNDKGTAVSTNAEVDSPNAAKKEGTAGGFTMMGLLNMVGSVAVFCILIGTLAGIPSATDIENTKDTTTALAANFFQSVQGTADFTLGGDDMLTMKVDNYLSLAYQGQVQEISYAPAIGLPTETTYYTTAFGTCDAYGLTESGRRLEETTHHRSAALSAAFARIEAKLAKVTGKTSRHLDEKVSEECGDRDDECTSAGQGASALFVISFILSFANAVVAFLTINGSDDTKTKISAALYVLVVLLTSIAVGLFTLDCTNLVTADFVKEFEEGADQAAADNSFTVSYTWVYTNGATFSCGMTAIVLSFVLAVLRFVPQPVADKPDVKEGENLVGEA